MYFRRLLISMTIIAAACIKGSTSAPTKVTRRKIETKEEPWMGRRMSDVPGPPPSGLDPNDKIEKTADEGERSSTDPNIIHFRHLKLDMRVPKSNEKKEPEGEMIQLQKVKFFQPYNVPKPTYDEKLYRRIYSTKIKNDNN